MGGKTCARNGVPIVLHLNPLTLLARRDDSGNPLPLGPALKMKLRFRVSCWDEAPSLAVPPPIPTSASRFARREDPLLQSFGDLVQGEGLESPCLYPLLGRRQPDGHLSSWSRTAAVKRCWTARDRGRLGSEERGDVEDRSRVCTPRRKYARSG